MNDWLAFIGLSVIKFHLKILRYPLLSTRRMN